MNNRNFFSVEISRFKFLKDLLLENYYLYMIIDYDYYYYLYMINNIYT